MTRGFNGPPDPHLLRREPLRADDLERQVIHGMMGFEFGTEEDIEHRLVTILESEAYKRAVQHWETKRDRPQVWTESLSNSSLAIAWDNGVGGQAGVNKTETVTPKKNKRFSGFDFYRRKLFSPSSSPPPSPFASPSASQSQLSNASLSDFNSKEPPDPTRGYHPLISIYYLAREKLERDRVYGPGHFASSQLSLNPLQPPQRRSRQPRRPLHRSRLRSSWAHLPYRCHRKSQAAQTTACGPRAYHLRRAHTTQKCRTMHKSLLPHRQHRRSSSSNSNSSSPDLVHATLACRIPNLVTSYHHRLSSYRPLWTQPLVHRCLPAPRCHAHRPRPHTAVHIA